MLRISTTELAKMRGHCERAYPHEACGVLVGTSEGDVREVKTVIECGNERTDAPYNRYQISPVELIAAQKQAREKGWEIIGFYHSHPDFPARWSATDLAEAHWLGCSYVITSVEQGRASTTNSFVLVGGSEEEKKFEGEEVEAAGPTL
jgi:proteasome lid subunit RPN8/RPN11